MKINYGELYIVEFSGSIYKIVSSNEQKSSNKNQ